MGIRLDVRHALRMFRRTPSVTAIIVLTLALCIGANTAIFSVIDAALLRPLPYPEPGRLAAIVRQYRGHGAESDNNISQTGRTWELVRDHATFLDAAAYSSGSQGVNFAFGGNVQFVRQQRVGAGFFRVLGIQPMVGREFTREEDRAGGPALAVLSFHLWKRLGGGASIAGQHVMLRGEPYTVVGVMPENFRSSAPAELWTPLEPSTKGEGSGQNYEIVARLQPGVTWVQAQAQMEAIGAPMIAEWKLEPGVSVRLHLVSLQQGQTDDLRKPLLIVWAAVGLVLLIGCANVTSLLLARAATRSREIATRLAMGGARAVIVRQLLVESLVLAAFGGLAGLLVGYAGVRGLQVLAADTFPAVSTVRLDVRVLAATALLSVFASLVAGIFPAFEASAVDIRTALTEAGMRGVAGGRRRWSRRLLVSGEVALAVLLLVGAGLLIRTLERLYQLRPGFDPDHVITASFSLQDARYTTSESVNRLFESGLSRIRELPGVESAAVALTLPFQRPLNDGFRHLDGPQAGDEYQITDLCYVTPDFFRVLRIPLLRGRVLRESDGAKSAPVAVVNDAFVNKYLSRQAPLGSHISLEDQVREIVGVAGDVPQKPGWGDYGPLSATPTIYVPVSQVSGDFLRLVHTWFPPNWIVRANGSPQSVTRGIQDVAAKIDPLLPIAAFRTLQEARADSLNMQWFQATLLASLSGLALLLAVVGIYGLMSQSVIERKRELGIRLALGASRLRAIRNASTPGIALALAGVAAGCVLAGLSARVMQHLIWGVSTTDPVTYATVGLGLLLIAMVASLVPALRIARLNPADTLREE